MKGGRQALRYKTGGGPIAHHNLMRDTLAAVHSNAEEVVGSETRHLLLGSREKPADVHAHGIGNQGRDIAIDVAIVDSQTGKTDAELQRRAGRRSATKGARRELLQWRSASCSEVWTVPLS
jgi:hypothetical protein